jgi:hypothetical protein
MAIHFEEQEKEIREEAIKAPQSEILADGWASAAWKLSENDRKPAIQDVIRRSPSDSIISKRAWSIKDVTACQCG